MSLTSKHEQQRSAYIGDVLDRAHAEHFRILLGRGNMVRVKWKTTHAEAPVGNVGTGSLNHVRKKVRPPTLIKFKVAVVNKKKEELPYARYSLQDFVRPQR